LAAASPEPSQVQRPVFIKGQTHKPTNTLSKFTTLHNIFQLSKKANTFLSLKKRAIRLYDDHELDLTQGIVCECCIHSCTVLEYQEYCVPTRQRRALRRKRETFYTDTLWTDFEERFDNSETPSLIEMAQTPLFRAMNSQKIYNLRNSLTDGVA